MGSWVVSQWSGSVKTTTSPRLTLSESYIVTVTRSPSLRVFSIDPDGMVKLWMTKVRMRAMITTATTR